ncbi:hypothetical protein R3P38DRAFT_3183465 [Favolaschia claudopus]|uniref:Uncharacterized protein n=1 Tax=Favolaschia claudopus TaxID=2862362 RepID=A0AAW0CB78_9AGAR
MRHSVLWHAGRIVPRRALLSPGVSVRNNSAMPPTPSAAMSHGIWIVPAAQTSRSFEDVLDPRVFVRITDARPPQTKRLGRGRDASLGLPDLPSLRWLTARTGALTSTTSCAPPTWCHPPSIALPGPRMCDGLVRFGNPTAVPILRSVSAVLPFHRDDSEPAPLPGVLACTIKTRPRCCSRIAQLFMHGSVNSSTSTAALVSGTEKTGMLLGGCASEQLSEPHRFMRYPPYSPGRRRARSSSTALYACRYLPPIRLIRPQRQFIPSAPAAALSCVCVTSRFLAPVRW